MTISDAPAFIPHQPPSTAKTVSRASAKGRSLGDNCTHETILAIIVPLFFLVYK
jgi:hypothetical protein